MEDIIRQETLNNKLELLFGITEAITGVTEQNIKGPLRFRDIAVARNVVGVILNKELGITTTRAGKLIGRDHSTIVYYGKQFEGNFEYDKQFQDTYTLISDTFWHNYIKAEVGDMDIQVAKLQDLINKLEAQKQSLIKST